ncbi:uncharacterized protein TNCV_3059841 [Trichonephila clavipes]|nr:uncharacterized protein TNCV_3059841 [Trichonephila clavipes]
MDPQNFVAKLQQHMAELKPLKSPSNRKQNIFVHKDLKSCSHVFLRIDRVKKALEPPYEGPYTVQKKYDKYFTILIKDKTVNVSVDRLKPAYLLAVDNQNEQTSVGQKNEISNWKELSPMPDEQSTTSCGRKIKTKIHSSVELCREKDQIKRKRESKEEKATIRNGRVFFNTFDDMSILEKLAMLPKMDVDPSDDELQSPCFRRLKLNRKIETDMMLLKTYQELNAKYHTSDPRLVMTTNTAAADRQVNLNALVSERDSLPECLTFNCQFCPKNNPTTPVEVIAPIKNSNSLKKDNINDNETKTSVKAINKNKKKIQKTVTDEQYEDKDNNCEETCDTLEHFTVPCEYISWNDIDLEAASASDVNLKQIKFKDFKIKYIAQDTIANKIENLDLFSERETDLIPGKYEGGLKVWECSIDLAKFLSENSCVHSDDVVLEVCMMMCIYLRCYFSTLL